MSDDAPGWIAKQDQWQAAVEQLAGLVGTHYHTLRRCGVPPAVAAELSLQYQAQVLAYSQTAGRAEER